MPIADLNEPGMIGSDLRKGESYIRVDIHSPSASAKALGPGGANCCTRGRSSDLAGSYGLLILVSELKEAGEVLNSVQSTGRALDELGKRSFFQASGSPPASRQVANSS
ncbi:hypothetical protein PGTUg99_014675 [Puccinia graminis f. sp. tritici]|uniref:Uncharacterized protein n=1 Tax=Puccinia graminis f. sp. tritici TaxID=56615 RepID=A0A5B0SAZ4_PUCGR|nr:hypothetical protein PGTUg99_014675 [Puccinia graminis f. sp. tritici]